MVRELLARDCNRRSFRERDSIPVNQYEISMHFRNNTKSKEPRTTFCNRRRAAAEHYLEAINQFQIGDVGFDSSGDCVLSSMEHSHQEVVWLHDWITR